MFSVPELSLVCVLAGVSAFSAGLFFLLARRQYRAASHDFFFDVDRALCVMSMAVCAESTASLVARLIGAQTIIISSWWLNIMCWISVFASTSFFGICRWEAVVRKHPFWPAAFVIIATLSWRWRA